MRLSENSLRKNANMMKALMPFLREARPYLTNMAERAFSFASKPTMLPKAMPHWLDWPLMGTDLFMGTGGLSLPYWLYKYPKSTAALTWGLPAVLSYTANASPPGHAGGGQPPPSSFAPSIPPHVQRSLMSNPRAGRLAPAIYGRV